MSPKSLDELAHKISQATGIAQNIVAMNSCSGGDINEAAIVQTDQETSWFVKFNSNAPDGMFSAEADGLNAMRATNAIRVPEVITHGRLDSGEAFLVLESIQSGSSGKRSSTYFETFGRSLAEMHRLGTNDHFRLRKWTTGWAPAFNSIRGWTIGTSFGSKPV